MSTQNEVSRRQVLAALVTGVVAIGVAGCDVNPGARGSREKLPVASVTMTDGLSFEPSRLTIRAGQTVEWRNDSVLVHTATADPEIAAEAADVALPEGATPFDSGNLEPNGTFRHAFTTPGTYRYFCIPHEAAGMLGEVIVEP